MNHRHPKLYQYIKQTLQGMRNEGIQTFTSAQLIARYRATVPKGYHSGKRNIVQIMQRWRKDCGIRMVKKVIVPRAVGNSGRVALWEFA